MSIGMIVWGREFGAAGQRIAYPSGLWQILQQTAAELADNFDTVQLPPMSLAQGGTGSGVDGYEVFEYRNFDGTRWGGKEAAMAAVAALHAHGVKVFADIPIHQMGGENGGPGVFKYNGRRGETTASWFQGGFQTDDPIPPFVKQDDIPSLQGDYAFGRVRSYENSIPAGVVEADMKDILNIIRKTFDLDGARADDVKATHAQSVRRIVDSQLGLSFYGEYFDGNAANLDAYAMQPPISGCMAVADYELYWRLQNACNSYDARLFDQGGFGYWQWNRAATVGFAGNPDVTSSWAADGGISQQIAFNLLTAYVIGMSLPLGMFLVYADDYFPPSAEFPNGRGLKPFIDNLAWFARTFAYGSFERRWVDQDVYAYTRDGNGGAVGWSGGCLVAVNFNTLSPRTVTLQTMWPEGTWYHDYSGHIGDGNVGPGGMITVTIPSNAWSSGQGYILLAPGGVNHAVAMYPTTSTQTYFGADDLLIKAAKNGLVTLPERIYAAKGTSISLAFTATVPASASLIALVRDVQGRTISTLRIGTSPAKVVGHTLVAGWHTVSVEAYGLPVAGIPFELAVTYTGATA
jgi:alpha-amylase